ncbi:MAG: ATP-binding protein [Candidatus Micrarchaeota archaeon]
MLIIVCGLPGSGKSTLARSLAKKISALDISSDIIRKRMFSQPTYSEGEKATVYAEMASRAEAGLRGGRHVIVDATFYLKKERERFSAIASGAGTASALIVCKLTDKETEKRLGGRKKGGASDADFAVYLKMKGRFEPVDGPHLEIDTSLPKKEMLDRVRAYLGL